MRSRLLAPVVAALALAALMLAGGCVGGGHALDGTSWRLTGWSLSSLDPSAFTITAKFSDGTTSGASAVNTYSGPYTAGPGTGFSVGDLVSTLMAGPEPAMRAEQAYTTLLRQSRSYSVAGDVLTLFDAGGNESLIFNAAAP